MGGSSGPSSSERAEQTRLNRQAQANFEQQQALGEAQFAFQQEQAALAQGRDAERNSRIRSASREINAAFDEREPVYKRLEDASFELNRDALNESRTDANKNLRFSLARSGLSGGSVDSERQGEIVQGFNQGLLESRNTAIAAGNQARSTDNNIRNSLLNAASSGNFSGSELLKSSSGALNAVDNSPAAVAPQIQGGDFFADALAGIGSAAAQYYVNRPIQNQSQTSNFGNSAGQNRNYFGNIS